MFGKALLTKSPQSGGDRTLLLTLTDAIPAMLDVLIPCSSETSSIQRASMELYILKCTLILRHNHVLLTCFPAMSVPAHASPEGSEKRLCRRTREFASTSSGSRGRPPVVHPYSIWHRRHILYLSSPDSEARR